jgi:hypothetical protein
VRWVNGRRVARGSRLEDSGLTPAEVQGQPLVELHAFAVSYFGLSWRRARGLSRRGLESRIIAFGQKEEHGNNQGL